MLQSNVIRRSLNMSPIGLNSLETRVTVSSPNRYNFKKPSVLALDRCTTSHILKTFINNIDSCLDYKMFFMTWYADLGLKKYFLRKTFEVY